MKILFYEVQNLVETFTSSLVRKQYLPKKIREQKWHGPLSHWCREGKTLVVRPLKKNTFFMCLPLLKR